MSLELASRFEDGGHDKVSHLCFCVVPATWIKIVKPPACQVFGGPSNSEGGAFKLAFLLGEALDPDFKDSCVTHELDRSKTTKTCTQCEEIVTTCDTLFPCHDAFLLPWLNSNTVRHFSIQDGYFQLWDVIS